MYTYFVYCLFDATLSCQITANNAWAAMFNWIAIRETVLVWFYNDLVFEALLNSLEVTEV